MTSLPGLVVGLFFILLSLPFLLFPRKSARIRYRHARDPEPRSSGVQEARAGGILLFLFGIGLIILI